MSIPVLTDKDHGSVARILNLPAPASDNEPVRKIDLTAAIEGTNWKDNARAASTGNVNLASPGATMDVVTLVSGNRVVLKNQTALSENGIYVWTGASTPLTRSADANTAEELLNAIVTIDEGTSNAGTKWRQTQVDITLETDDIIFESFGDAVADASTGTKGKVELATQSEVNAGTDTERVLTPETAKGSVWRGRGKIQQIGNGSDTQYDVTHSWGTYSLMCEVWETTGDRRQVSVGISQPSNNAVRINAAAIVASNALEVRLREVPTE